MVGRCSWEEAQAMAKRSPSRGFMPPASAIEIVLPDIGGTYADIQRFAKVPLSLKLDYHRARGEAFAYGGGERREAAERLLDRVLTVLASQSGRFLVLGGPGGRLATVSADRNLAGSPCRDWPVLFKVNRPLTPALRDAALGGALRHYELV